MRFAQAEPWRLRLTPSSEERKLSWWRWHQANPHVYELFERFSLEAARHGHTRFSHWLVMNRIRWETTIDTTGVDFKISNNHIAYYARLFMARHPEHAGFFHTKKMKDETLDECH